MIIVKPKLCSSAMKQSLFSTVAYEPFSAIKYFHYSYATRDLSSKPRVKIRKNKIDNKEAKKETGKKTDLNMPQHSSSLSEKHASLKEKKGSPSYVFSDNVAAKIAAKIIENRTNPSIPIIEYNPGPALLTRKLFKLGAPQIIGIERKKEFLPYLKNVQETFGQDKFVFYNWDPFIGNLTDMRKMDKLHQNEMKSFHNIKLQQWANDPYASIVGILNPLKSQVFLNLLQVFLGSKESLYSYGRPEMFLLVPVKNYRLMIVKDPTQELWTYGRVSSIWNLFFDIETLLEIHKSDVFPPFPAKRHLRCESKAFGTVNKDSLYLVKIIPKKYLNPITNCSEEYSRFFTFLNQITKNKSHRLIPKLESWIPGSGLHLIRMGFNMLHVTGDILPHKYLEIYQELRNLPEFKGSSLDAILFSLSTDNESRSSKDIDQANQTDHLPLD